MFLLQEQLAAARSSQGPQMDLVRQHSSSSQPSALELPVVRIHAWLSCMLAFQLHAGLPLLLERRRQS